MTKKPLNTKQKSDIFKTSLKWVYYLDCPDSKTGTRAVRGDKMLEAVLSIAKKQGLLITDEMILYEIYGKKERND